MLQYIATPPPLGMEISEFLVVFLSQDSDTARTSGLAECAKAVNKTNLGRWLLMLTCMKPRLLHHDILEPCARNLRKN